MELSQHSVPASPCYTLLCVALCICMAIELSYIIDILYISTATSQLNYTIWDIFVVRAILTAGAKCLTICKRWRMLYNLIIFRKIKCNYKTYKHDYL